MSILIRPVITEKTNKSAELSRVYTFFVDKHSNKIEIKNAVEATYKVSVDKVGVMNVAPKRFLRHTKRGAVSGVKHFGKKAMVKLSEGDKIDFYGKI